LDCPIKTAVFVNLKKFDSSCSGNADRYLMAHEYTQMAGRAGRRGIDTVGNVVHCVNMFPASSFPIQSTYKEILSGIPQRLISKFKIDYKMVLNILALQMHNPSDNPSDNCESKQFCDFIKGSMMSMELDKMESGILTEIADLETKISLFEFKFSIEDVKEYWKLQKLREMASNKKLKEIERDSKKMVDKYPGIVADYVAFCKLKDLESSLSDKHNSIESLSSFIENSIGQIMGVLLKKGIVEIAESMQLTKKGEICTSIAEVNPILMCELLEHFNDFEGVDPPTLAAFLSVFADVRCRNADSYVEPENEIIGNIFKQFMFVCDSIVECEDANCIRETLNTNDFSFAIADEVFEWCQCADENDCHVVLQGLRDEKGVSIGDFTKAMLKISTVVRELISVCEKTGKVELMSRLSQIDPLILKHVTTNQSLYL
jgi:superfamily II RNA helicase